MMKDGSMKNRETSDRNGASWNASDGENAYYALFLPRLSVCNRSGPVTGYWY